MPLNDDVEGCRTSIDEADHGDETASFDSRASGVSYWNRQQSSDTPYHDNDNGNGRSEGFEPFRHDRSIRHDGHHTSSKSSQHSQISVDSRDPGLDSLNNSRRPPSQHDNQVRLDRDKPGEWAINHHLRGLIEELEHETSSIWSKLNKLGTKIQEIQHGKKEQPALQSTSEDGRRFRISFAEVQRMRIRKLQCELVRHVAKMRLQRKESPGWEQSLEQYIKALQDHAYMESRSKSIRDPFLATGEYDVDNYVLNCNIDSILANVIRDKAKSLKPWDNSSSEYCEPITGTRGRNVAETWHRGFKQRVFVAAGGGAFLVIPMWIMVLKNGLYTSLISTTAFVTAFGILMAYFLDETKDVLASTAAYAAVLVVFVGTSNP
ncbi:hypothetical protein CGCVW01_v005749 [Colletotrichum viniferum]|nr:hypothetical protein CGCVW01_v005749 [Colletotrichum viniferum]